MMANTITSRPATTPMMTSVASRGVAGGGVLKIGKRVVVVSGSVVWGEILIVWGSVVWESVTMTGVDSDTVEGSVEVTGSVSIGGSVEVRGSVEVGGSTSGVVVRVSVCGDSVVVSAVVRGSVRGADIITGVCVVVIESVGLSAVD